MFGLDLNQNLCDFLKIDQNHDEKFVRNLFKVSERDTLDTIANLMKWAGNHPELPPDAQDEIFIRRMFYLNRFDPNRTKRKIEGFFQMLQLYPEISLNLATVKYRDQAGIVVVSPNHTENLERIYFCLLNPQNLGQDVDYDQSLILVTTLIMLVMQGDVSCGIRIVFDFAHVSYQHFLKFSPKILWKVTKMYQLAIPIRITGIELVNVPYFVSSVLGVAKSCLTPKIFNLITIHEDLDSLCEKVPKKCLPVEYGGDLSSLQKWFKIWDEIIENSQEAALKLASFVTPPPTPDEDEDEDYFFGAFI